MWDSQPATADNKELSREDVRKLPAKTLLKENRSQAESSLVHEGLTKAEPDKRD